MRLTLALIVKNEAALLPELLETHRELAEELLVVDTGSTDGTDALAAAAGARVEPVSWPGDFAAARNAALELARGEWILMLDADERLDADGMRAVRTAIEGAEAEVFRLTQRSYTDEAEVLGWRPLPPGDAAGRGRAGYTDIALGRLFRRRPELRFEGRIHELIEPSAVRAGLRAVDLDVVLHHYREAQSPEKKAEKHRLYLELSRKQLQQSPEDPQAALELAMAAIACGLDGEAAGALRPAVARYPSSVRLAEHLAVALLRGGRGEDVPEALAASLDAASASERPRLEALIGHALTRARRYEEAVPVLERALAADPLSFRSLLDLGVSRRATGDGPGAEAALSRAAELHPRSDLPLLNLALVEKDRGRLDRAEDLLAEAARRAPGRWQIHSQRAGIAFERGDYAAAAAHAERARRIDGAGADAWVRSCAAALALDRGEEALAFARKAAALDPRHRDIVKKLAV